MPAKTVNIKKEYNKYDLLEKIGEAKKSLSVIGATVFDLPWDQLIDGTITPSNGKTKKITGLGEKFFSGSNNFQIHILRESENLIEQYALLSQGKSDDESSSRGNLNVVREKVVKGLKQGLISYAKSNDKKITGIEPPEDIFKKRLAEIADDTARMEFLKEVEDKNLINHLSIKVKERIITYLSSEVSLYLEYMYKESKTYSKAVIEGATKFQQYIEELSEKIAAEFTTANSLKKLDIVSVLKGLGDTRCADGVIKYPVKGEQIWITIGSSLKSKIQSEIISFKVSDNNSASSDINISLNFARENAEKIAVRAVEKEISEYNKCGTETTQRLFIKDCYMPIPISMMKIDDELYITHALTKFDSIVKFQYVGNINSPAWKDDKTEPYRSYWIKEFQDYYDSYFIDVGGVQKYSTEETSKGDRKEVIDTFNESRVRIGTGPRDAFLSNMGIVKLVVWALIFDRQGNMLIHQRATNAKDNRGLWDKSVGGHVSTEDLDTIEAVRREIAEELYTIENEGQGGHDEIEWMITNINKVVYLGEWKTRRYPDFKGLNLNSDEYYLFSLNYLDISKRNYRKEVIVTERVLPGGKTVKAKCFVDPYLCIMAEDFDIEKLQNSNFAMLTPNELKNCVNTKKIRINKETRYYDMSAEAADFNVTSDLLNLVNSQIWEDVVTVFSKDLRDCFKTKK